MAIKLRKYYEFGEFRLQIGKPRLWRGDAVVHLRPKALEILRLLIENRSRTVLRDEILEAVWKDTFVEEGNINFNISQLRKAISNDEWPKGSQIVTVPKEGYRFVAEVREVAVESTVEGASAAGDLTAEIVRVVPSAPQRPVRWHFVGIAFAATLLVMSFGLWRSIEAESPQADLKLRSDTRSSAERYSQNEEAYKSYLRGRSLFDTRTSASYEKAILEYQNAIALDPNFALAYSGLADVYAMQVEFEGPRHLTLRNARQNALKALELDEHLAEAHTTLASIYRSQDWNWEASEKHFKRAIELDPNYLNARQWYAFLLTTLGRLDEALVQIEKAKEIDPLSRVVNQNYIFVLLNRREHDRIPALALEVEKLYDDRRAMLRYMAFVYERLGDDAKTLELVDELLRINENDIGSKSLKARLAVLYTRAGRKADARTMFADLDKDLPGDAYVAYHLAMAHADLGNYEAALKLLDICLIAKDDRMLWIKVEPKFDPLRNDPRFIAIVEKMGLAR